MKFNLLLAFTLVCLSARSLEVRFQRQTIDLGVSETCAIADINNDGRPDVFSGEAWYENPTWQRHSARHLGEYGTYLASLIDLPLDVDGDGFIDIVSSGWFNGKLWWSRNPGDPNATWQDFTIEEGVPVEFSFLVDLDNDGKARELLPQFGDDNVPMAWYEPVNGRFIKHIVSLKGYGHGIGAGDVNGDGRADIITPRGWLEAPLDPRGSGWAMHPEFDLGATSFIYVIDINEDGLPDLVTGSAHDYGIFWMEQRPDHTWIRHDIDNSWSEAHALTMVDLNGDGRKDFLTGKRFGAHDGEDPGAHDPLGIYWYEYRKSEDGSVAWSRHIVSYGSRVGGGMQIPVADIDGDGDLDFAVGGKTGLFLFKNLTRDQAADGTPGRRTLR